MANQNMSTPVPQAAASQYLTAFAPGDTSWAVPATAYYTFTLRGAGGGIAGASPGGSGAASQITRLLFTGQIVTFSVGRGGAGDGGSTVVTLPTGEVITATGGITGGAGGTATGGDLNISGNAGSVGLGGHAPAIGNFPAATTALSNNQDGPGTGASTNGGGTSNRGGTGIVYLVRGKAPRSL